METRHREEEENLAHCIVSSGGGRTQGFLPSAPDRGVPPPVNSPVESSQYSLCMHKCTCTVTCCRVPFVCLFHVNVFHGLLSVFIARACQLFNIAENGGWTGLEGSVSAALFTGE